MCHYSIRPVFSQNGQWQLWLSVLIANHPPKCTSPIAIRTWHPHVTSSSLVFTTHFSFQIYPCFSFVLSELHILVDFWLNLTTQQYMIQIVQVSISACVLWFPLSLYQFLQLLYNLNFMSPPIFQLHVSRQSRHRIFLVSQLVQFGLYVLLGDDRSSFMIR